MDIQKAVPKDCCIADMKLFSASKRSPEVHVKRRIHGDCCIIQHGNHIRLDIGDLPGIAINALKYILDMLVVQFQKLAADNVSVHVLTADTDRLGAGADAVHHDRHDVVKFLDRSLGSLRFIG